jgi:hypothetical protein
MSHHGSDPFDEPERLRKMEELRKTLLDTTAFRGALGDFPEGQLTMMDEGSIQFAIGEKDGKVVLDFGTPVAWIGMTPQQAADFASTLLKRAREVGRKNGESVGFIIG